MSDRRSVNRSMFWRVLRRSLFANRGRLFVILLALGAGAAITAALLNLQVDAKQRVAKEFRAFGPNAIVSPRSASEGGFDSSLMEMTSLDAFLKAKQRFENNFVALPFLYLVATANSDGHSASVPVVVVGSELATLGYRELGWSGVDYSMLPLSKNDCFVGVRIARELQLSAGGTIMIGTIGHRETSLRVKKIWSTGGPEDDQVFVHLDLAQQLANAGDKVSIVKLYVLDTPEQISKTIVFLQERNPEFEIRPIRQFTEGEARLYGKISGILTATVGVVLLLTALCVMAAMTNVAMERKNDVGLMKAIGGSVRRVLRLFLAEAALLGLAGGLIGAAVGIVISIGLGKAVFGVAAQPRLIVYPISVALTVIVAILAAYPLRRLVHIKPAAVFRGEE